MLTCKGASLTDNLDISNALNDYFSTVGSRLVDNLLKTHSNISPNEFVRYCDNSIKNSMFIEPVDSEELMWQINNLKNGKSPGPDRIGPLLLKEISSIICPVLVHIFNLSLSTGVVPDKLKVAKVVPVYKKADRQLACNYLYLVFLINYWKKIVYNRLYYHIQKNNILYKYQFGFRHITQPH